METQQLNPGWGVFAPLLGGIVRDLTDTTCSALGSAGLSPAGVILSFTVRALDLVLAPAGQLSALPNAVDDMMDQEAEKPA